MKSIIRNLCNGDSEYEFDSIRKETMKHGIQ